MKKLLLLFTVILFSLSSAHVQAQAFDKSTKLITLSLGPGEMIHFPVGSNNYYGVGNGVAYNYSYVTGQLSVQAEFAVHKYVGVGFVVGVGGEAPLHEVNIPIGLLANFHFFQLIADKQGLELGNKLDVYAGVTAGSGVAIHLYNDGFTNSWNDALFYFGPHAGVNYYFANNIAVHGEVGWGVTVLQAGITFKLGGGKGGSSKTK
jgi:hypothetical protein